MTTDLVTWLREQITEDEQIALAANVKQDDPEWWVSEVKGTGGRHFTVRSERDMRPIARAERLDGDGDEPGGILDGHAVAEHIARHDVARVLAEVDAKRRILDEHEMATWPTGGEVCVVCREWPCVTVRLLALPYADRPGYRDEWRP